MNFKFSEFSSETQSSQGPDGRAGAQPYLKPKPTYVYPSQPKSAYVNYPPPGGVATKAPNLKLQSPKKLQGSNLQFGCLLIGCSLAAVAPKRRYGAPRRRKLGCWDLDVFQTPCFCVRTKSKSTLNNPKSPLLTPIHPFLENFFLFLCVYHPSSSSNAPLTAYEYRATDKFGKKELLY